MDPKGWTLLKNEDYDEMMRIMLQTRFWYEVIYLIAMAAIGWSIGGYLAA